MERKSRQIILLILLILVLFSINYSFLNDLVEKALSNEKFVNVIRIIDGDTIVVERDEHVRLLGINTPEKGEKYSDGAKKFLEEKVLGKNVKLVFGKDKTDKYYRLLAYVYLGNKNINLEIVENGFANYYFPSGKDRYYENFKKAWENCVAKKINLCEKSKDICANCIELNDFDYKNEILIFHNKCDFDCDLTNWDIKDEGRKHFTFEEFVLESGKDVKVKVGEGENSKKILFWSEEDYVWTDSGDTIFLRDSEDKLILWRGY